MSNCPCCGTPMNNTLDDPDKEDWGSEILSCPNCGWMQRPGDDGGDCPDSLLDEDDGDYLDYEDDGGDYDDDYDADDEDLDGDDE